MVRKVIFILSFSIITKLDSIKCMEPFIVGGEPANIEYYSYSAYITLESYGDIFVCGSSIINQNTLLSAAHCFEDFEKNSKITVRAGSANKLRGAVRYGTRFAVHKYYDPDTVENDIALVYIKRPFILGTNIKRVVLTKHPPRKHSGHVSGWGLLDESRNTNTDWLQQTEQTLWSRTECNKVLKRIPDGSICGGAKHDSNYASSGDSGSALVVDGYIQVGLVSFKRPDISRALVVYTNVAYYYEWIVDTTEKLFCY